MIQPQRQHKAVILALLLMNAGFFLVRGEFNDSFDSMAWIVLMILYEVDSGKIDGLFPSALKSQGVRQAAILVVILAELSYWIEGAWLDGLYSLEWILVVALFELETRRPQWVSVHPFLFRTMGLAIMLSMIGVIGAWLSEGSYFNAYDALLWSIAFLIIDLDILNSAMENDP
jgi:hypothetical protein